MTILKRLNPIGWMLVATRCYEMTLQRKKNCTNFRANLSARPRARHRKASTPGTLHRTNCENPRRVGGSPTELPLNHAVSGFQVNLGSNSPHKRQRHPAGSMWSRASNTQMLLSSALHRLPLESSLGLMLRMFILSTGMGVSSLTLEGEQQFEF